MDPSALLSTVKLSASKVTKVLENLYEYILLCCDRTL